MIERIALPLATSALFAGSFVAGKYTTLDLEPLTTTLGRYLVALAVLAALRAARRGRPARAAARRDLPALVALGLSGVLGYHFFFFTALAHTAVANTAIINALSPVATAIAAAALLGERIGARAHLGVVTACAGVLVLVSGGDPARVLALDFNAGDLAMLAAVGCWAVYGLLLKRLSARYRSLDLTFHAALWGVVVLLVATPLAESPVAALANVSAASIAGILYMGVAASGLGYLLYAESVARLGPTRTASVVYGTVPVLVAALAWAFFGEAPNAPMAASVVLIALGLRWVVTH